MSSAVLMLAILMLAAGALGGWLCCARFGKHAKGKTARSGESDRRNVESNEGVRSPIDEASSPCVRNTFSLALGHRLAESTRRGDPLSMILVHVDHFERLGERYGLPMSNQILDAAGRFFIASVRGMDWVARFDLTTFAILLPNTAHANALHVAERLRTTFASSGLSANGVKIPLSLSLGTSELVPGDSSEAILRRAEEALNDSKRQGGNCIRSHVGSRAEAACSAV